MKNTEKRFVLASFNPVFCQKIITGEGGECCWPKLRHRERARRGPNEGYPKISIIVRNQNSWVMMINQIYTFIS